MAAGGTQQPGMPVVGFMSARSPNDTVQVLDAFHKGLSEGGFVNGRNVSIDYRWAHGDYGRSSGACGTGGAPCRMCW